MQLQSTRNAHKVLSLNLLETLEFNFEQGKMTNLTISIPNMINSIYSTFQFHQTWSLVMQNNVFWEFYVDDFDVIFFDYSIFV